MKQFFIGLWQPPELEQVLAEARTLIQGVTGIDTHGEVRQFATLCRIEFGDKDAIARHTRLALDIGQQFAVSVTGFRGHACHTIGLELQGLDEVARQIVAQLAVYGHVVHQDEPPVYVPVAHMPTRAAFDIALEAVKGLYLPDTAVIVENFSLVERTPDGFVEEHGSDFLRLAA